MRIAAVVAFVTMCTACNPSPSSGGAPSATVSAKGTRPTSAQGTIPSGMTPLFPKHGVYAAGGGLMGGVWTACVDFDAGTIRAGHKPAKDMKTPDDIGPARHLDPGELQALRTITDAAWREPHPPTQHPIADYTEDVFFLDGDSVFRLQGFGPIRSAESAALVKRLRGDRD